MHRVRDHHRLGGVALPVGILLCLALGLSLLAVRLSPAGPAPAARFVDITAVDITAVDGTAADLTAVGHTAAPATAPAPAATAGPDASSGTFEQDCGRNQEGHRNADNVVVTPGTVGGAHHLHDYVGNLSTDADSTDDSLADAATTCTNGDRSTYYWPVLRRTDRAAPRTASGAPDDDPHGNTGEILTPDTVTIEYLGNPWSKVVPMPRFLRLLTGDPTAATDGGADAGARWGCTGFAGRTTTDRYPLCPAGSLLTRTLDFPSCWDGRTTDSSGHRSHVRFPSGDGICPHDTFPVPHLRVTVGYRPPPPRAFALDSFPEQRHSPLTDHAVFIGLMTDRQMAAVVACLNQDRACRESG